MKVFIVIPCYNEAKQVAAVLKEVKPYGSVVVVDDGSSDQSYQVAKSEGVKVLRHLINRGMGAALATGNSYALSQGAEVIVHFDADGQHLAADLPQLLEPIVTGSAEVVFGSRFLNSASQIPFFKKWLILKPAITLQNLFFGLSLSDAHNGLRALTASALKKIEISQDRMAHASEIISQVKKLRLKYQEVPVTIKYYEFGQGFLGGLKILKDLLFGKLNKF